MFVLGVGIAALYFYVDTHNTQESLRDRTLQAQAQVLVDALQHKGMAGPNPVPGDWAEAYSDSKSDFAFTIYGSTGEPLSKSRSLQNKPPLPLVKPPTGDRLFGSVVMLGPKAEPALTARVPGRKIFVVVGRSNPDDDAVAESVAEEQSEPLIFLIPFAFVAAFAVYWILALLLRPLEKASRQATEIGPANLKQRIESEKLPAEVRPLADAFNATLDRLVSAYELERRFTANAAHELRTPLSVLTLQLQKSRDSETAPDWHSIDEDLRRMKILVSQLLDLARKEVPRTRASVINLSRVLRESVAALLPVAEESGRGVDLEVADGVMVHGPSADDLRDLCTNLIDNALIHGRGVISVTLSVVDSDGRQVARMTVADEGTISSAIDREALFERFKKGSENSAGSGLGLAIAAQVAANFGGVIHFVDGPSTAVRVDIPAQD